MKMRGDIKKKTKYVLYNKRTLKVVQEYQFLSSGLHFFVANSRGRLAFIDVDDPKNKKTLDNINRKNKTRYGSGEAEKEDAPPIGYHKI